MRYFFVRILVMIIVLAAGFAMAATAQSGNTAMALPKAGLIADVKANQVGDIVTILINESANASNSNSTQTNAQNSMEATADFGGSFLRNLTGTISSDTQNQYQGNGQTTSSGTFTTQLSARIVEVQEDGNFLIRASREIEQNGDKIVTVVEGIIRPTDISKEDAITMATSHANVQRFIEGKTIRKTIFVPRKLVNIVAN